MADQVENKIVNVIFDNKDFSKKIDATIRDLQRFEQEIDNISKINLKNIKINVDIDFDNSILYDKLKEIDKNSNINLKVNYNNEKLYSLQKDISNIKIPNIKIDIDYETLYKNIANAIENVNKSGIFGKLLDSILDFPGSIISGVGYQIGTNIIGDSFGSGLVSKASGIFKTLIGGIFLKESSSLGDNIGKNLSNSIGNTLNSNFKRIDFSGLLNNIKGMFSKVGDSISPIVTNIKSKLSTIDFSGLLNNIKGMFSKVTNFMSPFINTIKTKIQNIDLKGFTTKFKSVFNKITTFVSPLANTIKTKMQNIDLKGFTNKFKSTFNKVGEMVSPLANKIKEKLSNINVSGIADKVGGAFKKISSNKLLMGAGLLGGGLLLGKNIPIVGDMLNKLTGGSMQFNQSLDNINQSVDNISSKFTVMGRVWFDTLTRMAQNAVDAGLRMVKSLSVDNIMSGYQAMEAKNNSIRTIMNSTVNNEGEDDEAKLERITDNVEKLVTFTDETSYNFQDMMNGLSSFTSAGVDLEKSVSYMMGIANWAAYAGKNAKEAGTAFDVMSKVIANGNMDLMRFRQLSTQGFISNATRKQWLEMASKVGTLRKEIDSAGNAVYKLADGTEVTAQNMETTLTKGKWLNADVITQSLGEYAKFSDTVMMYYNNITSAQEEMAENGENVDNISNERLEELAKKYNLATSDLKKFGNENVTVSKLIDILGNSVDENGNRIFEKFSVEAFKSAQEARTFGDAIESVKVAVSAGWSKSFETIFGNVEEQSKLWTSLANRLYDVFMAGTDTRNLFLKFAKDGGAFNNVLMGISNLFNSFLRILNTISDAFKSIFFPDLLDESKGVKSYADSFIKMTENFATWTAEIAPSQETIDNITNALKGLFSIVKVVLKAISVIPWGMIFNMAAKVAGAIGSIVSSISNGLLNSGILDKVSNGFDKIGNTINKVSSPDIVNSLLKVVGILLVLKLTLAAMEAFSAIKNISKGMETLQKSMRATAMEKQASAMLKLAAAVAIISASLFILSKIDILSAIKGLSLVAIELGIVIGAMFALQKLKISGLKVNTLAIALIAFAGSLLLLTASVAILGNLKWETLGKGLLGVVALLGMFVLAFKYVTDSFKGIKSLNLLPVAAAIIAFASAMLVLSAAVAILGVIPFNNLVKGMIAVGLLLAMFAGSFILLSNVFKGIKSLNLLPVAAAIIAFASAMVVLSAAVAILGSLNIRQLIKGLGAVIILLGAFVGSFYLLSKIFKGLKSLNLIPIAIAIGVFASSMLAISAAIMILASIPTENLIPALVAMALTLGGIIALAYILQNIHVEMAAVQILALGAALLLCSVALKVLDGLNYINVAIGIGMILAAMIGMGVISGILSPLIPLIALFSASLLLAGLAALSFGAGIALGANGIDLLSKVNYQKIVDGFGLIAANIDKLLIAATGLAAVGLAGMVAGIGASFQGVGEAVKGTGEMIGKTLSSLGDVASGVGSAVKGAGEGIGAAFKGIGEGIGNLFSGGSEEEKLEKKAFALTKVAEAMEKLKDIGEVTVATEGLQSSIDNVIKEFSSSIQNLEQYGKDSSINYMRGIINGLKDEAEIEKLKGSVIDLANTVKDNFDKVLKIESPSKVGRDEGGYYVIGIGEGIYKKTYITEEAAKKLGLSTAESFEEELSDEKAKDIADNWTEDMAKNLKEKENDFKTIGKDEGGYYVEGIKDGVEGKHYITDEAAEELGISMAEETKKPFTDENQKKILTDNITSYFKGALDNVDLNNLKNVTEKVANNLLPTNNNSDTNKESEEDSNKRIKAHKSFLKNYKNELNQEQKMVKYFANKEKEVYKENSKNQAESFNNTLTNQTDFTANAQQNMNTWLDQLVYSYEQADSSFNDYLENLDENTSKEDKINARRLEALKKFNEEYEISNSGMDWGSISVTKKFESKASEVKPHEAVRNLQSYLDAYEGFKKDMERMAGTNISPEFLSALYKDGPNGELFLAAKSMDDAQLELLGATWDSIHKLDKNGDSEFLSSLHANRDSYKASHIRNKHAVGSKENPYVIDNKKYITQGAVDIEMLKRTKDEDKREEIIQKIAQNDEEYADYLRDELAENEIVEDDTFGGPGAVQNAYTGAYNQVAAIGEGIQAALPTLQQSTQLLNQNMEQLSATQNQETGTNQSTEMLTKIGELQNRMSTAEAAIQQIINSILQTVQGLINTDSGSVFEQEGLQVDQGLANGIINNIGVVTDAVIQMCNAAIQAARENLGIASPSTVFYQLGNYMIQGLCNAITDGKAAVTDAMVNDVLSKMSESAEKSEGIASPSKKWYQFGSYIDQGLAKGISENVQSPMNALGSLISDISENMEMDEEYNPVITPVLDLSEAKKQSKGINTLFASNQAMQISADLHANRISQNGGNNSANGENVKTITFTQNNYSPKELSRLEIYRQTNNQFSQLKTLLDK